MKRNWLFSAVALLLGIGVLSLATLDYLHSPANHKGIEIGPIFIPIGGGTTPGQTAQSSPTPGASGSPSAGPPGSPTAKPKPTPPSLLPGFSGTWVLQQANSTSQVDSAQVEAALSTSRVRGYSLRVPWQYADGSSAILDAGAATAARHHIPLAIRFMAGMNTPARVFAAGSPFYISNGVKVPTPFMPNGSPNTIFESYYKSEVAFLANWCRGHGVHLLHMAWYGRLYAQLDDSTIVNQQPGYSYAAWLSAHERLVNIAWGYAGSDLAIEFPVDGNDTSHHATADLTKYIDSLAAKRPSWFYQQTNGLGVYNTPPLGTLPHAQQMYGTGDYDWNSIYSIARNNRDVYLEIYASSFAASMPHHSTLMAQIASFG